MIEGIGNLDNQIDGRCDLQFCLLRLLKDKVRGPPPSSLDEVPYMLYGVQGAALWRQVAGLEGVIVKVPQYDLALVDLQVVHNHYGGAITALLLKGLKKWQEGLHSITAGKD